MILLTVPHSECPKNIDVYHFCDYLAPKVAKDLQNYIINQGEECIVFWPEENRIDVDFNRPWSRLSDYREDLRYFVLENRNDIKFILDIHSFPPKDGNFGKALINILDDDVFNDEIFSSDSISISSEINKYNIPVALITGDTNDIQDEMKELGQKSLLMEWNEILFKKQHLYNQLINIVGNWLIHYDGTCNFYISKRKNRIS